MQLVRVFKNFVIIFRVCKVGKILVGYEPANHRCCEVAYSLVKKGETG